MNMPVIDRLISLSSSDSLPERNIIKNESGRIHSDWVVSDIGASSDFVDGLMREIAEFKVLRNPNYFEDDGSDEWVADYEELQNLWSMVDGINEELEEESRNFNNLGLSTSIEVYQSGSLDLSGLSEPENSNYEIRLAMYETAPDPESYFENKSYWKSDEVLVATVSGYIGDEERRRLPQEYEDIALPEV